MNSLLHLLTSVIDIYMVILIAAAIMSWLFAFGIVNTRNRAVEVIAELLYRLTEPALRPIRRILPRMGGIDLSPIVLILLLQFLRNLLVEYFPADPAPADPAPPAAGWPFTIGDGCVRLAVRLTPGASADRLLGVAADEAGLPVLRAQVTAAPENGKANAALVGLLAKRWRLPRSSITVMQGATGRRKLLRIAGEPAALARRIMEALERDD